VIWISHRGLKTHTTENTKDAFQAARGAGFQCFETDLRVTADDHLVLSHDTHFGRMSDDHRDLATLERHTLEKVVFHDGSRPYFFDEFIEDLAAYSWVLDIKPEYGLKTLGALEKWMTKRKARAWMASHAKFLTWNPRDEARLKDILPEAKLYAREMECWRAGFAGLVRLPLLGKISPQKTYAVPPSLGGVSVLTRGLVREFHKRGALVVAFLPKNRSEEVLSLEAGVDEVLTDGMPL